MANGTYKLLKQDTSGNWNEVDILAENGKILAFDSSLNPILVNPSTYPFYFNFYPIDNITGSETLYNPTNVRTWYYVTMTNIVSTYNITLSAKPNPGGGAIIGSLEHYITLINTNGSDKTLVIQLETTGHKKISENISAISLPACKAIEISYYFQYVGSNYYCFITKSPILTVSTQ